MTTGKLCLAALLSALPAIASAQSVSVDVGVNVGADQYDTVAPGDPVESVDVFYDQLEPYGVWVDEPDVGRVFIPDTASYVPYTTGHWQYTSVGFVWVSSEPHAWATSHYGRWAYSNNFGRWYWLPDTEWGPAWVEWRQTGSDFGWAPLAPAVVIRAGWQPPVETWHYCGAEHVLDVNVTRYYEPRERVIEIHRQARPIDHYATVSSVRVAVGPPAATLREHRIAIHPVKVEARTVGRWTPAEAHAQVARAQDHRATFEAQNQHRIEANARIHTAQVKVVESHPQIKAQVNARVQVGGQVNVHASETTRGPSAPNAHETVRPAAGQPAREPEPRGRTPEPAQQHQQAQERPQQERTQPPRSEAPRASERAQGQERPQPEHNAPPARPQPQEHAQPQPEHNAPPARPQPQEHAQPQPEHNAPPARPQPQEHAQPPKSEAPRASERKEPDKKEPDHKDEHH